jgi:hypothetical protein
MVDRSDPLRNLVSWRIRPLPALRETTATSSRTFLAGGARPPDTAVNARISPVVSVSPNAATSAMTDHQDRAAATPGRWWRARSWPPSREQFVGSRPERGERRLKPLRARELPGVNSSPARGLSTVALKQRADIITTLGGAAALTPIDCIKVDEAVRLLQRGRRAKNTGDAIRAASAAQRIIDGLQRAQRQAKLDQPVRSTKERVDEALAALDRAPA